jgi:hypothetical protein
MFKELLLRLSLIQILNNYLCPEKKKKKLVKPIY